MAEQGIVKGGHRPKLAPGVRLQFDDRRQAWFLLAPERLMEADGPAKDILSRCDGRRSVAEIVEELAQIYTADRAVIDADVRELLADLVGKRLLQL